MNELIHSESPYLLQHKAHPIHWKIWNDVNLGTAIKEDKLLIISIGYSSCHWCHVMAHECFEDQKVAETMNTHFISFKIDREENPDIDAIYMNALQLMTRQGGWPLNIVALPNGYPIWGCTYLPKEQWNAQLQQLHDLYIADKERVLEYADQLHQHLHLTTQMDLILQQPSDKNHDELYQKWISTFDYELGGTDRAPKFILPTHWNLLFQYSSEISIKNYIKKSLTTIQNSGIHDVIEGGFYRYSVDHYWHIPHFEKMLYDQAQLISTYTQAYLENKDESFLHTAQSIVDFISCHWKNSDGGYFGSCDADSLNNNEISEEGYYYLLTQEDIDKFPKVALEFIKELWNISPNYLWEKKYIHLYQTKSIEEVILKYNYSLDEAKQLIEIYKREIKKIRATRAKPNLDTKRITSWNALLLSGIVDLYLIKPNTNLKQTCEELYIYLSENCLTEQGILIHTDTLNEQTPLLEDYASSIQAFLKYYQINFDTKVLLNAKQLLDSTIDLFYDDQQKFFTSHIKTSTHIVIHIEIEDNVIPSSNSIMCENLLLASILFNNTHYQNIASHMLDKVTSSVDSFSVYSQWFAVYYKWLKNFKYLIADGYTKDQFYKLYQHYSDYNLYIINRESKIPISMLYSSMKKGEIQICNRNQCFLKENDINNILNK